MQDTTFSIPADLDTPVSAYLKIQGFNPRFLLESVENGETLGRYSFIGFGEGIELHANQERISLDGKLVSRKVTGFDLLSALRQAQDQAPRLLPDEGTLPFTGGMVGAAGFDLGTSLLTGRSVETDDSGTLALYYAPPSLLVFDHVSRRIAVLHSGSETERRHLEKDIRQCLAGSLPARPKGHNISKPSASLSKGDFMAAVRTGQQHITAGDVYQIVLSIKYSGETDADPFETYRALRLLNPSPYMYFFQHSNGAVVGSSPEALVQLSNSRIRLRPIAGTRPRGDNTNQDMIGERELLADPKEAAEHVMLVDLARNDAGRVATAGSVAVEPFRSIERYSHVMHLVSGVTATLESDRDAFDVFASAFPAGTVSGAPKIRAMELIKSIEPVPRGLYAGTVGYFGQDNRMDQAIAIRTLVFEEGQYSLQAGAGIVADSDPATEFEEVQAKSAVLRSALSMSAEGL